MQNWDYNHRTRGYSSLIGPCLFVCPFWTRAADLIVKLTVPSAAYSRTDGRAIFTILLKPWPNGGPIVVFALGDDNPDYKDFVKKQPEHAA